MDAVIAMLGLGMDSFLASWALGACGLTRREMLRCAIAFGACDATAALAGALWPPPDFETGALCVYLLCPLLLFWAARGARVLLYVIPILLSIDNLFSGTSLGMVPVLGMSSAVMALAGMGLATLVRERIVAARLKCG